MKLIKIQRLAAAVACLGMVLPTAALSAESTPQQKPASMDVALGQQGLFVGQLVDAQGTAQQGVEVAMLYNGREVVRTATDDQGVFAAKGLRGGQYQVVAQGQVAHYRLWNAGQAPPAARPAALLVTNADIVRGQYSHGGGIIGWAKNHPLAVSAGIVAAVAIPVAINASDDDDTSS